MDILELIKQRRSIFPKQYTGNKVDKASLEKILESAIWAPTHKMTQPWKFKVYSEGSLNSLIDSIINSYKANILPENQTIGKAEKIESFKTKISHSIAIILHRDKLERIPEEEELCAVAAAVQNMHLAASYLGIGAYWSTGLMHDSKEIKEFLGLEENERCLGFFIVGETENPLRESKREPLSSKTEYYN